MRTIEMDNSPSIIINSLLCSISNFLKNAFESWYWCTTSALRVHSHCHQEMSRSVEGRSSFPLCVTQVFVARLLTNGWAIEPSIALNRSFYGMACWWLKGDRAFHFASHGLVARVFFNGWAIELPTVLHIS